MLQYVSNQFIGELCNGSTTDSDSVCEGSNPSSPAKTKKRHLVPFLCLDSVKLHKKDLNKALRKPFGEGFLALTEGFCKAYISNTAFLPCKIREQYPSSPAKKKARFGVLFSTKSVLADGINPPLADEIALR